MPAASHLSLFKEQIKRTISDLKQWVDDPELEKAELKIMTALKINARDTTELFIQHIKPYAGQILDGNEKFFIDLNIDNELEKAGENDSSIAAQLQSIRTQVKSHWDALSVTQCNQLKNHFKLLIMLGAIATRNETIRHEINKRRDPSNPLVY